MLLRAGGDESIKPRLFFSPSGDVRPSDFLLLSPPRTEVSRRNLLVSGVAGAGDSPGQLQVKSPRSDKILAVTNRKLKLCSGHQLRQEGFQNQAWWCQRWWNKISSQQGAEL